MRIHPNIFYAKILLFGEYSVLKNSMGLSIPYTHFRGELSFLHEDKYTDQNFAVRSNQELRKFHQYLLSQDNGFDEILDLKAISNDLDKGMYFESTIPESYGLGSSGALCAAIYKRYGRNPIGNGMRLSAEEILKLKNLLSKLEAGFHGTSSGLDPLNSYLKVPLLIQNREEIEQVSLPGRKFGANSAIFLINSGQPGNTEPLVRKFLEKCQQADYLKLIEKKLIPMNNTCVKELVDGRVEEFFGSLKQLSRFQLQHFQDMIPCNLISVWKEGLETDDYWMKLCGSGGGGFILGFTRNYDKLKVLMKQKQLEMIPVYQNQGN